MLERTLVLVKPDAVKRRLIGKVLSYFESELTIAELRVWSPAAPLSLLTLHYKEHKGKPFYLALLQFMASEPLVAAIIEGYDAVCRVREIVGATDPVGAKRGTIRSDFGWVGHRWSERPQNLVHASDSLDSAQRELGLWFPPESMLY